MPATPDPDLALQLAKAVADIYGEAVDDMLEVVARRLAAGIDQPGWAERKLLEVTRLRDEAQAVIERLGTAGPAAIDTALAGGWEAGGIDAAIELGTGFGTTHTRAIEQLATSTVDLIQATHPQILRSVDDAYRQVIAATSAGGVVGTQTRRQAAQRALDRFADQGITGFVDNAGRRWQLDSYAEMATRTAIGRAQVAGTLDRYQDAGRDLVIVSDAPQECSRCRPWEGRVLSITGTDPRYPSVSDATTNGLFHANCRHMLGAYIEGLTRPLTRTADPEGDALRQEQRRLERGVRHWKRREATALDDRTRAAARHRRHQWENRLSRHVERNGLKRLRYREVIGKGPDLPTPPRLARTPRRPGPPATAAPAPAALVSADQVLEKLPGTRSVVGQETRRALAGIDRIHRLPADLPKVPVLASDATSFYGAYTSTVLTPVKIQVARFGDHKATTFAHELGHYLDHQLLGNRTGKWGTDLPELAGFIKAVDRSEAIGQLRNLPADRYTRYYLRRDETWARAYAQWVALRSGDSAMVREIQAITNTVGVRGFSQWSDEDFEPIARTIDTIFEKRGLLT